MHPVAAQGLNLGVRDALALAARFAAAKSLNNNALAQQYAAGRRPDASHCGLHPQLGHAFRPPRRPAQIRRGGVMALLDSLPAARKKFTRQLIFGL